MSKFNALLVAIALLLVASSAQAAPIILETFNVDEGRFGLAPTFSGSTTGMNPNSTAELVATGGIEGGFQQLILNDDTTTAGGTSRLRHLSGGGSAGGASGQPANTPIPVAGAGTEDGWIGYYLRTTSSGWTTQLWIEGPEANGGVPKNVIADGEWHLYEWNLDDESGGADGWGAIAGIIGGDADVQAGNYTIDSMLLRHDNMPSTATIDFDFVARSDSGTVANLVPEPASLGLLVLAGLGLRRRSR